MRKRIIVTGEGDDIDQFESVGWYNHGERMVKGQTDKALDIVRIGDAEAYDKVGGPEIQQLEYELDPAPDPEPLTDLDKLRNRVNGIELTYDRRLDEMKAHYEGLLRAANGADLNKLRYDLTGLEKEFAAMGPISLNQVMQIAKDQVQAALGCYPTEMAGFIQEMREWALRVQKDLEERLKIQMPAGTIAVEWQREVRNKIALMENRLTDHHHRLEFLGSAGIIGSYQPGDVDHALDRIKTLEARIEERTIQLNEEVGTGVMGMENRVKELKVLVEQDHNLLFHGDLGLGIRIENIEMAIGGTDNEYDINRRLNELRDRERKLESVVTDIENIHQGHGHAYEPKEARTRIDAIEKDSKELREIVAGHAEHDFSAIHEEAQKQWEEINGLIKGLQVTDRNLHALVGQVNKLEEMTDTHLKDHEGRIIGLEEATGGACEIQQVLGRIGKIEEKAEYIFNELYPNDPGRAGGVVQDLYALQRTDYKNLTKRIDACMKEINGHGHTEFGAMGEDIGALGMKNDMLYKMIHDLQVPATTKKKKS